MALQCSSLQNRKIKPATFTWEEGYSTPNLKTSLGTITEKAATHLADKLQNEVNTDFNESKTILFSKALLLLPRRTGRPEAMTVQGNAVSNSDQRPNHREIVEYSLEEQLPLPRQVTFFIPILLLGLDIRC